jgi:hypothetical protein
MGDVNRLILGEKIDFDVNGSIILPVYQLFVSLVFLSPFSWAELGNFGCGLLFLD